MNATQHLCLFAAAAMFAQDPAGLWQATLPVPGQRLRIGLEIEKKDAAYSATMISIDQAVRIPVASIAVDGVNVKFAIPEMSITYEGTLNEAGTEMAGTFTQGAKLPLTFRRVERFDELIRPQTPKPPFPYDSEEVTFPGAGVTLGGTITKPKGEGPFPAVVLLTGSGAQDRDESIFGHKPFAVLADYFSRRGFAVLRMDDRGVGQSSGSIRSATLKDFAGDAVKAVEFLKARPYINAGRIGILGHSEGGLIAPQAAIASTDVAFLVLMAGPGVNGADIMFAQAEAIQKAQGIPEPMRQLNRQVQEELFAIAREESEPEAFEAKVRAAWAEIKAGASPAQKPFAQAIEQSLPQGIVTLTLPLMREWLDWNPAEALRKLTVPVLVINGSLDLQVLPEQNLPPIAAALAASGSRDWAVVLLPGLNHLFQTARTGAATEYAQLEETLAPVFLQTVSQWLARVAGVAAPAAR